MTVQIDRELVRQLRLRHSHSQEKLAEIVGVNLRTIQRIEKNGQASLQTRAALARAFDIEPEALDVNPEEPDSRPELGARGLYAASPLAPAIVTVSVILLVLGVALAVRLPVVWFESGELSLSLGSMTGLLIVFACSCALTRVLDLRRWRLYVLIGIVAISMLSAPPNIVAQTLLVAPLWLMFELSLFSASRLRSSTSHAS